MNRTSYRRLMPEGHVVHHQARQLARAFRGHAVQVDSPQGRFSEGAALVSGQAVTGAEAFGKHLLVHLSGGQAIHVHLGLFGKWRIASGVAPEPVGEIRMRLRSADHYAELRGPTRCEVLDPGAQARAIARIGPDPIRRDADPERAWRKSQRSRTPFGALLMDQSAFAGVGNIYRAEVLFRNGINPYRTSADVTRETFDAVWTDLVQLMRDGVRKRRIDTVRPEHLPKAMGRPARRDRHGGEVYVYRRHLAPCLVCGSSVSMATMQGRNLYWCANCQPD